MGMQCDKLQTQRPWPGGARETLGPQHHPMVISFPALSTQPFLNLRVGGENLLERLRVDG